MKFQSSVLPLHRALRDGVRVLPSIRGRRAAVPLLLLASALVLSGCALVGAAAPLSAIAGAGTVLLVALGLALSGCGNDDPLIAAPSSETGTPPADADQLDGTNGYILLGGQSGGLVGRAVGPAGDVNGDGYADMVVGATLYDGPAGPNSGAGYVVFGGSDPVPSGLLDLSTLDGSNGFRIDATASGDVAGSLVGGGDINGDGYGDVLFGSSGADSDGYSANGSVFVIFGGSNVGAGATVDAGSLATSEGFRVNGNVGDLSFGIYGAAAGDVNGDGFDDFLMGSPNYYAAGSYSGAAFLLFGAATSPAGGSLNLNELDGSNGFFMPGQASANFAGAEAGPAGDVNGDGYMDLAIGARYAELGGHTDNGVVYVVFGGRNVGNGGLVDIGALDGSDGFALFGETDGDKIGYAVAPAGDMNGDGYTDLVIGTQYADHGGINVGEGFVVFGKKNIGASGSFDLAALDGSNGFRSRGENDSDFSHREVQPAGDVNGDGYGDLLLGADLHDPSGVYSGGRTYVLFGGSGVGGSGTKQLSNIDADSGFTFDGVATFEYSSETLGGLGDVNGDGFADIISGASGADGAGGSYNGGQARVVLGGNFSGAVGFGGTDGDDTQNGGSGADVLFGGPGDDTLKGRGGADVLRGGPGDDVMTIEDDTFLSIDGGLGADTLKLNGPMTLDLTELGSASIRNIERVDLGGNGNAAFKFGAGDIAALLGSGRSLIIDGSGGQTVTSTGQGWQANGSTTIDGKNYDRYKLDGLRLFVRSSINNVSLD